MHRQVVLCLTICMLLFLSMFAGLPRVSTSLEAKNSKVFWIVVEKNHANTTFTVNFAESALAINSTLTLPTEVIKAINGSSRVIVTDSSGSYGEALWYNNYADISTLYAWTHYHLSATDAINTGTALWVTGGLLDLVAGIVAAASLGILAISATTFAGWIATVTAYNYDKIYSTDHNPDQSFDFWTYMTMWQALWGGDYFLTPYHCWFCTTVGAYIVGGVNPPSRGFGAGHGWKVFVN